MGATLALRTGHVPQHTRLPPLRDIVILHRRWLVAKSERRRPLLRKTQYLSSSLCQWLISTITSDMRFLSRIPPRTIPRLGPESDDGARAMSSNHFDVSDADGDTRYAAASMAKSAEHFVAPNSEDLERTFAEMKSAIATLCMFLPIQFVQPFSISP
jgi:hypothetical protein